jgi:outer membrane protein assembly factor BamE (lipoprotein component of BamABCDE complex)
MTANELADDLSACFTKSDWKYVDEAVATLRQFGLAESIVKQQQVEIKALKEKVMQNADLYEKVCDCKKKLELSNEEILKMASDKFHYSEYRLVIEFVRAILKKASEK